MKYKSEKEEKFDKIYQLYSDEVYKVCIHLVKNKALALEIMQEAFVEFYEEFENVNSESMLSNLVRIVKNLVYRQRNNS